MADPTSVPLGDVLAGESAGLNPATARAKAYADAIDAANARMQALEHTVRSPSFAAWAKHLDHANRVTQQLNLEARNRQYALSMESGAAVKHLQTVTALNREYDLQQMRVRNQATAADLASGAYLRHSRALAAVNKEQATLKRHQEIQDLVAEHGRVGGAARAAAPHLMVAGRGMGMLGLFGGIAMARTGLSGTQEGVRLEYQLTRLSRQMTAIAIPAFETLGNVVGRVAGWFERLSGRQQDMFLKLGLFMVALPPLMAIFKALGAAAAFAGFSLKSTAVAAPVGAGVAGAAGAAGASVAAGGAVAGGAVGAGGAVAGGAAAAGGGGAVAAGAAGGVMSRVGGFARAAALPVAGVAAMGAYGYDRGIYDMLRREGRSEMIAGIGTIGLGAADLISRGAYGLGLTDDTLVGSMRASGRMIPEDYGGEKKRKDVTPFGNQEMELGGTAQRIQETLLEAMVARRDEREAEREALRQAAAGATVAAEMMGISATQLKEIAEYFKDRGGLEGRLAARYLEMARR